MSERTHEVANQPPPLAGYDAWSSDSWLREAATRAGAHDISPAAAALGRYVGSAEAQDDDPDILDRAERQEALQIVLNERIENPTDR